MFRITKYLCLILLCNQVAFGLEQTIDGKNAKNANKADEYYLKQMQTVFHKIKSEYVQESDLQDVTDEAIDGMLKALDPYSGYYADEDLEFFKDQTDGEFGGIGVEITYENRVIKVITPIDDLPAYKAGIEAGDYIIGVNGRLVSNLGFNKAVREMRGKPGTKVSLLIAKESDRTTQEMEIVREIVKIKPIKFEIEEDQALGGIGYIRISAFNNQTTDELKQAVENIQKQLTAKNLALEGLIIDLRNNPGGLLDQAVRMCEYFLEKGNIVSIKGRKPESSVTLSASMRAKKAPAVPMAVLINSGSASAAEIVAGALQDYHRAVIIGTPSFGKGLVQTFVQLDKRSGVKLTTAKYYTPNGRSINATGIIPDIEIKQEKIEPIKDDETKDAKFSEASIKSYLEKYNNDEKKDAELANEGKHDSEDAIEKEKIEQNKIVMSERYKTDYQYARAYDVIRGMILHSKSKF
jgi:carboxyl-terminal processing protease